MNLGVLTLACHIFEVHLGTYRVIQYLIGKLSDMVKMGQESLVVGALLISVKAPWKLKNYYIARALSKLNCYALYVYYLYGSLIASIYIAFYFFNHLHNHWSLPRFITMGARSMSRVPSINDFVQIFQFIKYPSLPLSPKLCLENHLQTSLLSPWKWFHSIYERPLNFRTSRQRTNIRFST